MSRTDAPKALLIGMAVGALIWGIASFGLFFAPLAERITEQLQRGTP